MGYAISRLRVVLLGICLLCLWPQHGAALDAFTVKDETGNRFLITTGSLTFPNISGVNDNVFVTLSESGDLLAHTSDTSIHYPQSSIDHTALLNTGTYTHAQIDAHINDTGLHGPDITLPIQGDTVLYTYIDQDTIEIQPGGQFRCTDGTQVDILMPAQYALSIRLTTGQTEQANTFYYLWCGHPAEGCYFSTSSSVKPAELSKGKRLRGGVFNGPDSYILEFFMDDDVMLYSYNMEFDGSDETEVFEGQLNTLFTTLNFSPYVPAGRRRVYISHNNNNSDIVLFRDKSSTMTMGIYGGWLYNTSGFPFMPPAMVDDSGLLQIRTNGSAQNIIILVTGYTL